MKKYFLTALLAVFLCAGIAVAKVANVACPTNSTTCTVVSNSASKSITVAQVISSASTTDSLTFNCGSTAILGPLYHAANSMFRQDFKLPNRMYSIICAPGSDLTVIKGTSTTPVTIWLDYDQ